MGGSKAPVIQTPTPPAQPTVGESMADYAANLPKVYETQLQYMPKFSELAADISQQLYPETTALQENLATQAREGMSSDVPDWMKKEYMSNINAQLGQNVKSGIGADYMSRGLLQQKQDWQNYYRQLGLSVSGQQQLVQPPSYEAMYGGMTPQNVMGFNQGTYSPYASSYANMYGTNARMAQFNYENRPDWMGMAGSGVAAGMGAMAMFSSIRYKKNVKKWELHLN